MVKLQADGANTSLIAINNTGVYYLLAKRSDLNNRSLPCRCSIRPRRMIRFRRHWSRSPPST